MKLDDIDRKLLEHLQLDAGLGLEQLGERVGLSRNACWRRIKALEASGVIVERVALVDPEAVGCPQTVFIQVRTRIHTQEWSDAFAAATRNIPEVLGIFRMSGDLDYLIKAQVANVADYDRIYKQLTSKLEMAEVSASFVMEKIKDTTALPL